MGLEGFWAIGELGFVNGYPNMTGGMGGITPVLALSFIAVGGDDTRYRWRYRTVAG